MIANCWNAICNLCSIDFNRIRLYNLGVCELVVSSFKQHLHSKSVVEHAGKVVGRLSEYRSYSSYLLGKFDEYPTYFLPHPSTGLNGALTGSNMSNSSGLNVPDITTRQSASMVPLSATEKSHLPSSATNASVALSSSAMKSMTNVLQHARLADEEELSPLLVNHDINSLLDDSVSGKTSNVIEAIGSSNASTAGIPVISDDLDLLFVTKKLLNVPAG